MRKLLTLVYLLLISVSIFAQIQSTRLEIGDKVPDVVMKNIINYPTPEARLSDFKGKLVILDFWNRRCGSCIKAFPKMESLQEEFDGEIQILLVTKDKPEDISNLMQHSPIVKNTNLPIVMGDSILSALFPYTGVPFHVWINAAGKVVATTDHTSAASRNIQAILKGEKVDFVHTRYLMDKEIINLPLIDQLSILPDLKENLETYSIITKWHPGIGARSGISRENGITIGFRAINTPLIHLISDPNVKKVIVECTKPENMNKYFVPTDLDELSVWKKDNVYCYEIRLPKDILSLSLTERHKWMERKRRMDFEQYLGITTSFENKDVKCLILYRTTQEDRLKTKGGNLLSEPVSVEMFRHRNIPVSGVVNGIQAYVVDKIYGKKDAPVVIDQTGYSGRIDIEYPLTNNLAILRETLAKYGLGLKEDTRNLRCLIIKEN